MQPTLAYDVYGTLIDTHGLVVTLHQLVGEQAMAFSQLWREKQLEYSFRRGLMQHYVTFAVCTAEALDYTCRRFKVALAETQKEQLLRGYHTLPAFEEVKPSLVRAKELGFRLFAFSNGSRDALEMLLGSAGIRELFLDLVSVDEVKSFKPNPGVYCHFLRRTGASGRAAWLISSTPLT